MDNIISKIKEIAMPDLFSENTTLRDYIENKRNTLLGHINVLPIEKVDISNEQRLLDYCIERYGIEMVHICDGVGNITYDFVDHTRHQIEYFIPFEGDRKLLTISPYAELPNVPQGRIVRNDIVMTFQWAGVDAEEIDKQLHQEIAKIQEILKETKRVISGYNDDVLQMAYEGIKRRREELQAEIEKEKKIGYKKRGDE